MKARRLDRRVVIERRAPRTGGMSAGQAGWEAVATVWASVMDIRPARGERLEDGLNIATRPATVFMRYRTDVTTDMRLVMGDRFMQIITVPAEIGRREGLEFRVETASTEGSEA